MPYHRRTFCYSTETDRSSTTNLITDFLFLIILSNYLSTYLQAPSQVQTSHPSSQAVCRHIEYHTSLQTSTLSPTVQTLPSAVAGAFPPFAPNRVAYVANPIPYLSISGEPAGLGSLASVRCNHISSPSREQGTGRAHQSQLQHHIRLARRSRAGKELDALPNPIPPRERQRELHRR